MGCDFVTQEKVSTAKLYLKYMKGGFLSVKDCDFLFNLIFNNVCIDDKSVSDTIFLFFERIFALSSPDFSYFCNIENRYAMRINLKLTNRS